MTLKLPTPILSNEMLRPIHHRAGCSIVLYFALKKISVYSHVEFAFKDLYIFIV